MEKYNIVFRSIEQVKKFVNLACKSKLDMDLGEGAIIIDAKSIVGILSIGMNKEMVLTVHGKVEQELKSYILELA